MISKIQFKKVIHETYESILRLTETKGEEYSGSDDQLANFKRSANEAGILQEQAWLVFFNKHVDAIKSYVRIGKEKSEPIESRIDDAILYLLLLRAMVHESKGLPEVNDLNNPKVGEVVWVNPDQR